MSARDARNPAAAPSRTRDVIVAASCGAFVALMVGMAYAAVPLYDWFCRTTGFGGRTQVAVSGPANVLDRKVSVRFDANIAPGLPWRMIPGSPTIEARLGDVVTVNYIVINEAARETVGTASYNVTPLAFGIYFQKINCFCFTEQRLKAGEKREMTVVFYVDPALVNDSDAQEHDTLTLSYTFHPQREPRRPVADDGRSGRPGRILDL